MLKLLYICLLSFFTVGQNIPKDITGKWVVDKVEVGKYMDKMNARQRADFTGQFIEPLTKAVFEFRTDKHFYLSANINGMPKDTFWEYNQAKGEIKIHEYIAPKYMAMGITIVKKNGALYFKLRDTPIILKVHKKAG
jgi:hypothetical protein